MRILLTRPAGDSEAVATSLGEKGFDVALDPLINISYLPLAKLNIADYQGLVFTSANGVKSFMDQSTPTNIAVYTVGNKTAETAKKFGFENVINADGDVEKLSHTIISHADPAKGPLLYLRGAHISGDLKQSLEAANFNVQSSIIYDAIPSKNLQDQTINMLKKGSIDYIPFYSSRSALIFIELIKKAALESCLSKISALCLSPAIERSISALNWKEKLIAKKPTQEELFKMIDVELKG